MSLHLCLDCATIYLIDEGIERVCPRCGQALILAREMDDGSRSWVGVVSEAAHGPAPRIRKRWEVG